MQLLLLLSLLFSCALSSNYYKILGVSQNASTDEIKQAYKKLSKQYHPDMNPGDPAASEKFIELSRAYEILSDPKQRNIFDRYGEEGLKNGGAQFQDPFEMFFSFNQGFHQQRRVVKGSNTVMELHVSLEELYTGHSFDVEVNKQKLTGPNQVERGNTRVEVWIERGMRDGEKMVFPEEGDESPGKVAGDLIFVIVSAPHFTFIRRGNNLYARTVLTLAEAQRGFKKELKHLDGTIISLQRSSITQPGFVEKIPGKGMPIASTRSTGLKFGALFVTYTVVISV